MRLFTSSLSQTSGQPPTPIVASIKRFRYGADYSISDNTDRYLDNAEQMEFYSLKYSIRATVYDSASTGTTNREVYTQNVMECSIYWPANIWCDGVLGAIADYQATVYTQLGVDAYVGVNLGDPKVSNFPNHGQEIYDLTGGRLGTNIVNDVIQDEGTEGDGFDCVFSSYENTSPQGHKQFSYALGKQGSWQLRAKYFLGGRGSLVSDMNVTWFDEWDIIDRSDVVVNCTSRYENGEGAGTSGITWIETELKNKTIPNGGWFRNFTHWHTVGDINNMNLYYEMLQNTVESETELCWFAGMSEAIEYRWFLDMITGVSISGNTITVDIDNKYNLDLTQIITPISVEIDLTGTSLQGQNITSDNGRVMSLGSNKFIIEVYADTLHTTISSTVSPDYIDLNYPIVDSSNFSSGTLTIGTDRLTVATLFSDEVGTVVERKLSNATQHVFNGLSSGQTYYLGIMSRENKSIVQMINT